MPMTTVNGMKVPKFAVDGKGANDMKKKTGMKKGGMTKGMAKGGLKKKAYAKGGRVAMYNLGGMVSNSSELNTGITKAKGKPKGMSKGGAMGGMKKGMR
jgi:hypothetical protein